MMPSRTAVETASSFEWAPNLVSTDCTSQATQASATRAQATPVRELRVGRAADQDVLDGPRPVEKHPHLPSDLPRQLGQLPGELVRDEAVCVESSPDQALEGLDLAGFEAVGIAVNLDEVLLLPNR